VIPFAAQPVTDRLLPDDQVIVIDRDDSDHAVTERPPTPRENAVYLIKKFGNVLVVVW
jgi:hypothetical protein